MTATHHSTAPFRVLVAEFLLANSKAARSVASSMLTEAEAMLTAFLTDITALPNVHATVLLSAETVERFLRIDQRERRLPDNINILCQDLDPVTLQQLLHNEATTNPFDGVFLIAPECNGVLVSLLKTAQTPNGSPLRILNLDWRLARIFADKQETATWLQQHGISCIEGRTIDDATADALRTDDQTIAMPHPNRSAVVKPIDGAGAENVRIVRLAQDFESFPQKCSDDDRWLLQPLMPGIACSIGFIGGGSNGSTTILPPALQEIITTGGQLSYHGGQVPCESNIAERIAPVAQQLASALGSFDGYVGADMLVNLDAPGNSRQSVCVVEINPRLCTSYVGYRTLAIDNLAEWLLQRPPQRSVRWNSQTISYSASGEITRHKSPMSSTSPPFSPWQGGEGGRRPDEGVVHA